MLFAFLTVPLSLCSCHSLNLELTLPVFNPTHYLNIISPREISLITRALHKIILTLLIAFIANFFYSIFQIINQLFLILPPQLIAKLHLKLYFLYLTQ